MLSKFLDPKNDLAFKRIFGIEQNKDILIHFLNDIFGRTTNPIEEVTFLEPTQNPKIAALRTSIVDILCQDAQGNRFIIEMQVARDAGFTQRMQYYVAQAYIHQRSREQEYKDLKEVTLLAITNHVLFPEEKSYLSQHHLLDTKNYKRQLENFSFYFLELPKFNKPIEQLKTMTEKWAYFFKHAHDTKEADVDRISGGDVIIKRAFEELNQFNWTEGELRIYDKIGDKNLAEKARFEEGLSKGKEEGFSEGLEKGKHLIAKSLLSQNVDIATIAQATGLSVQEIQGA